MPKKNVTIRDIAEKCGFSTATISRVINKETNVAEATRKKVLDALKQYGYHSPDHVRSTIKKVGIVMRTNTPDYNAGLLRYITDYFFARNIQVVSNNVYNDYARIPVALDTLYDAGVSGVLLIRCPYLSIRDHLDAGIPHVWIDCNDSPKDAADICCVQSDHYISGRMAAMELIKNGCMQPLLVTGADCTHRTYDRNNGFLSEYEKHGVALDGDRFIYLPSAKDPFLESREMIRYLLAAEVPFDSVFAINDWRALGAYTAVESMGMKVPQDIKIIGFDGLSHAARNILNITCIRQNLDLLADNACVLLDSLMNGQPVDKKHIIIQTDVLRGQTL